ALQEGVTTAFGTALGGTKSSRLGRNPTDTSGEPGARPTASPPAATGGKTRWVGVVEFDRVQMVLFEDVSAAHIRLGIVIRAEPLDVDPVFAAFDFFFKDKDSEVIAPAQPAPGPIQEHLHDLRARGIAPHLVAQFIGQHV